MLHTHKSQSALEYLMTYGWAILIIVIVAVILYSMGIFNPSSSISTTITGFSSTPVSSAIFTDNGGLSLSVQNSVGYPIEITNITATTTTGGKVTIEPNITLLPGKSQVLVLSKVFTASSQNSHISTAVVSTGSITGSTLAVIYPANYTFAAVSKLTITNTQSSATSNPFQQMVNITSADNGWQLISNGNFGQNVEFFYSNGTVIPSWLESYSSSNAIWWLKIAAIPAGSSETVYVGFAPTTTNLFNTVNDGEAPQLSPTYAEYDDGANVFNFYDNFAGTSLDSKWGNTGAYNFAVNNMLDITGGSGNEIGIYSKASFTDPYIIDAEANYATNDDMGIWWNIQTSGSTSSDTNLWAIRGTNYGGDQLYTGNPAPSSFTGYSTSSSTGDGNWHVYTLISGPNNNPVITQRDYSTYIEENNFPNSYLSGYIGPRYYGGSYAKYYWINVRAYPPNGVMPSVTFGSVA